MDTLGKMEYPRYVGRHIGDALLRRVYVSAVHQFDSEKALADEYSTVDLGVVKCLEEGDEDNHLDNQRKAAGEGVGIKCLVELHKLLVHLLGLPFVSLLDHFCSRLDDLHHLHSSHLYVGQPQQKDL